MRWLPLLLLLLPPALAITQTFEDMGIDGLTTDRCVSWEIPYRLEGECTPLLYLVLLSGDVNVIDNGTPVLHADTPGSYRVLLGREGIVTVVLCPGKEGRGQIDRKSAITCVRTPLAKVSIEKRDYYVQGYDTVSLEVCNEGTLDLNGRLILRFPPFMAPLSPLKSVYVNAGECIDINIPVIVSSAYRLTNMPPICVEYNDPFGTSVVCSPIYPTRAKEGGAATCVVSPQIVEIFNPLPFSLKLGGASIEPFSYVYMPRTDENALSLCKKVFYVEHKEYEPKSTPREAILAGLILMGFVGIWARWERVKKE